MWAKYKTRVYNLLRALGWKPKPSVDWVEDCKRWHGRTLSGNYMHWCPDWDYLPIDDTCIEFTVCTCPKVK